LLQLWDYGLKTRPRIAPPLAGRQMLGSLSALVTRMSKDEKPTAQVLTLERLREGNFFQI